ncbi:hypothetical protein PVT71_19655 [Salipiger sp. H15]|uniref:Uncharacterized protein n=1 Tax=Alloyangia sp. H15 TaxID=3029062 RepID=A0AAU8AJZ7_9RHOB
MSSDPVSKIVPSFPAAVPVGAGLRIGADGQDVPEGVDRFPGEAAAVLKAVPGGGTGRAAHSVEQDGTFDLAPATAPGSVLEAEDFEILSGFRVEQVGGASGGAVLHDTGTGAPRAQVVLTESGLFDITIGYFDETDGVSFLQVLLNGEEIAAFDWDGTGGSALADGRSAAEYVIEAVELRAGDVLELGGDGDRGEPLRVDRVTLSPRQADVPGDLTTPYVLGPDAPQANRLETAGDRDWFAADLLAGHTYIFSLTGDPDSPDALGDPYLRLYDEDGQWLAENDDWIDLNSLLFYTPQQDQRVYAAAGAFGDYYAGDYLLRLYSTDGADSIPGSVDTGEVLLAGETAGSRIDYPTDEDWYAVDLQAGYTYTFSLTGDATSADPLLNPIVQLYDAEGYWLADAWDWKGPGSVLEYTPYGDERVYASAGSAGDGGTGDFLLSFEGEAYNDTISGWIDTQEVLVAGEAQASRIDYGYDEDWYAVDLQAGYTYTFTLTGDPASADPLLNPLMQLYDADGYWLTDAWGWEGPGSVLEYTPFWDERVYASAGSDWDGRTGDFLLTLAAEENNDTIPGSVATAEVLQTGETQGSRIDYAYDEDWYAVDLQAGYTYTFTLTGDPASSDPLLNPLMQLYDAEGYWLTDAWDWDGPGSVLEYTPFWDERVYASAGSAWDGGTGDFLLSFEGEAYNDTIPGWIDTDEVLVEGEAQASRIDYSYDEDWFAVDLLAGFTYTFTLTGDPDSSDPLLDPMLQLYDSEGYWLTDAWDWTGPGSVLEYTPVGDALVYASAGSAWDGRTGDFLLSVTAAENGDTIPGSVATEEVLVEGQTQGSRIDYAYDQDWYAVDLLAGNTYTFTLSGDPASSEPLGDPIVLLYDVDGYWLDDAADWYGSESVLDFMPNWDQRVYVAGASRHGTTGDFLLSFSAEVNNDTIPGGTDTGEVLLVGETEGSRIDYAYDQDWYAVDLQAGYIYTFTLTGDAASSDPLLNPLVQLYDANGHWLRDAGIWTAEGAMLEYTPDQDARVYASAGSDWDEGTGDFLLSLAAEVNNDTIPGSIATGEVLVEGETQGSRIDYAFDQDWYAVDLQAGYTYTFTLTGDPASGDPLLNPLMQLYDAEGFWLAEAWDWEGPGSVLEYSPGAETRVYASAGAAWDEGTGDFLVSFAAEQNGDTIPGSIATGEVLVEGETQGSRIDYAYDEDWFAVDLQAGYTYTFTLTGDPASAEPLGDPLLKLFDADGYWLGDSYDWAGPGAVLEYTQGEDVRVYVSAGSWSDGGAGDFLLTLSAEASEDAIPDTVDTEEVLPVGGVQASRIDHSGDRDWFAADLLAGHTYVFSLTGDAASPDPLADPYFRLYDAAGDWLGENDDWTGLDSLLYFTAPEDQRVYASAGAYGDYYTGDYLLSLETLEVEDAVPGSIQTLEVLLAGGAQASRIDHAADQDWYAVDLQAGNTYTFTLTGDPDSADPLGNPLLQLYDGDGFLLLENDDWLGLNSLIEYTPVADLRVYVAAGTSGEEGTGDFLLSLAVQAHEDGVPDDTGTTEELVPGVELAGRINYEGDRDWYGVQLVAGTTYVFDLTRDYASAEPLVDPYFRLYDAAGELLVENDDYDGLNSRIYLTAESDARVYAAAGAFSDNATGDYILSVADSADLDTVPGDASTAEDLPLGGEIAGRVDFQGDDDWYRVQLVGGTTYRIDLLSDADSPDPLADPTLYLYDAEGGLVTSDDDGGEGLQSSLVYTPVADEVVYASARAFGDTGTGDYRISVAEDLPSVAVLLEDVPAYDWYHGCSPTAAASIFGYWDLQGYSGLFEAEGWDEISLTANVQDQISSPAHNARYDPTPDDTSQPVPPDTSIADFMGTSVDPLGYGGSYLSGFDQAFEAYASLGGYEFVAQTLSNYATGTPGGQLWDAYVAEIDAGRPVPMAVDSNGDGIVDHSVPGIGYEDRGSEGVWYAAYTTWSESETPIWREFQPVTYGESWGVSHLTFVQPADLGEGGMSEEVAAVLALGLPEDDLDDIKLRGVVDISEALASDGVLDPEDLKILAQAKLIDFAPVVDDLLFA